MSGNSSSQPSTLLDATFHSMEEVNELTRAIGREGEFRQLSKGRITSQWRSLHLEQFSLTSHRLDKRVHARLIPPKGCVSLGTMPPPYFMSASGVEFGNDKVLMTDTNSDLDLVTPNKFACYTLVLPECDLEVSARALFPRFPMLTSADMNSVLQLPSSELSALHFEMRRLLHNGRVSPEDLAHLLSRILEMMAGEPEKYQRQVGQGNISFSRVAKSAREYIEDHYRQTIRMEDLCRHTGVSMRTLQRAFCDYFQVRPFEYVKARRLNAVRQTLVAGDPSRDQVTRIAVDNGFTHLGRFSSDYREHFDELPKETLGRSKLSTSISATGSM